LIGSISQADLSSVKRNEKHGQFAIARVRCHGYTISMYTIGHHLDFQASALTAKSVNPHGVLGQTLLIRSNESRVGSGPNGEGVVEGIPSDYEVQDGIFGVDSHFNRFVGTDVNVEKNKKVLRIFKELTATAIARY